MISTPPPPRPDPTGMTIAGRYEIARPLGHGAFGRTFLAHDRATTRDVAVKLLDPRGADDWKAHELFDREAAVLRALRHHGIPEVHDLVTEPLHGSPVTFLVMEYIEGSSIAQMIEERRQLDPAHVMHLFLEMLGILEYLHGRVPPILHRDIKPSNIIVRPDGLPTLVDFGSVRRVFLGPEETGSTVAGTYGYMPYEQYMGQATASSDLYALAATFLHLLTGRPPRDFMTGEGRIEVPAVIPGDPRLRPILARLLRPSPADRYATARDVRQALLSAPSTAVTPSDTRRADLAPALLSDLPSVPRELTGPTAAFLERVAPRALELMDSRAKPTDEPGPLDWVWTVFFSVITLGALPIVFASMARSRRRQLRRFFRDGVPGSAEVLQIQLENTAFEQQSARVSYQFEADGAMHRDSDQIMPFIAYRLHPGDRIPILFLPDRNYDSVIVIPR